MSVTLGSVPFFFLEEAKVAVPHAAAGESKTAGFRTTAALLMKYKGLVFN